MSDSGWENLEESSQTDIDADFEVKQPSATEIQASCVEVVEAVSKTDDEVSEATPVGLKVRVYRLKK